jgi:hypothetical protein
LVSYNQSSCSEISGINQYILRRFLVILVTDMHGQILCLYDPYNLYIALTANA